MLCVCRKIITVAGMKRIALIADAEFKHAADDPVRLILGVDMRVVSGAGRVDPLENAIAFLFHTPPQLACIRRCLFTPTLYSYAQNFLYTFPLSLYFQVSPYVQGALNRMI